jgi:dienelactone hydrolase
MAEVVLYHHIQGLTEGVRSFADELQQAGHTVHTPDLFDGRTFATMDEAFAFVRDAGGALDAKADGAAQALPEDVVYAGISWGVGAAQRLAQTRAGARGALLYEACFPVTGEYAFGSWPNDVPVQIHGKAEDEFFAHEGDIDAARELVAIVGPDQAELFVYPGDEHLFVDSSLPTYDRDAAALVTERTLQFLSAV